MKNILTILLVFILMTYVHSKDIVIEKIEPPNWWTGMKTNHIQLMIYGESLNNFEVEVNTDKIKIHGNIINYYRVA